MTSPRPERGYLLCTMPRSGSTMLCDLLTQTGVAGRPNSFFRPQSMANFAADWGVPTQTLGSFDQSYIDTAIAQGTAGTGCFGMRIMWQNNMPGLLKRLGALFPAASTDLERFTAAFGELRFIHLLRRDKVAEAVSYAIAEQSGLWHRNADGSEMERIAPPAEPIYDYDQIHSLYREVNDGHSHWQNWFHDQAIAPMRVTYEDLVDDPATQLRGILGHIGLDPDKAANITPGTAKLADQRNTDWVARFRDEAGLAPAPQPT
ncbi:MAG: Stf0 family sulfotransferase [Pseudomonadota bacterium]